MSISMKLVSVIYKQYLVIGNDGVRIVDIR